MREYAFIDLHIHTEYSRKEAVRETVLGLLDRLEAMAEKAGKPVVFSITDHESILGCIEAYELIKNNPEKYKMLIFIPGIELSTSLKSLGLEEDGSSIYKHLHLLGYGYNLDDPELLNFSKLIYQKNANPNNKSQYWETGYSVLIAKKALEKHFNKKIPFAKLAPLTQDGLTHADVYDLFVKIMAEEYGVLPSEIEKVIEDTFHKDAPTDVDVLYNSKQDIFDLIDMIHNAGGYTSIAHANSIRYKNSDLHPRVDENGKKVFPFYYAIKIIQERTGGKGIDAMEIFHSENTDSAAFFVIQNLAREYNMFLTCGSDSHKGLHTNLLSRCNSKKFEKTTLPEGEHYSKTDAANLVISLPFVDMLVYGDQIEDRQDFMMYNVFTGKMDREKVQEIMGKICAPKVKVEETTEHSEVKTEVAKKPAKKKIRKKKKIKATVKRKPKKKTKSKPKEVEYDPDEYYHAFSGKMKRDYDKGKYY